LGGLLRSESVEGISMSYRPRPSNVGIKVIGGAILIIILIFSIFFCDFTDAEGTTRLLQTEGYTDIEITGYRWGMKSLDDHYCTGFTAKNPSGSIVSGAVTKGIMAKGSTMRFDE
jgi:hypothetical protein